MAELPKMRFAPDLLRGKVALVTGGGTGMGRATAIELARCGADVAVARTPCSSLRGERSS